MNKRTILAVVGIAFLSSSWAVADVTEWNLFKLRTGQQTADNTAPISPFDYEAFAQLFTDNSSDFLSVTLNGPGVSKALNNFGGEDWETFETFSTQAALDAAYPVGAYTLDTTGSLGAFSESIQLTATVFPGQPVFTGSVYSSLQGADPNQSIALSWNAPTADEWFLFVEEVNGPEVFSASSVDGGLPTATSATIPAGTLQPSTNYEIYMTFASVTADVADSFLTGTSIAAPGFGSETFIAFQTGAPVPEPATLMLAALALPLLLQRRG